MRDVLGAQTVALASNRDEDPQRPWSPPAVHRVGDRTASFAADHKGGTWLGTNGSLLAALTNLPPHPAGAERSRGLLVRDLLASIDPAAARERIEGALARWRHDGFHLLVANPRDARIFTWDGANLREQEPGPGCHLLRHRSSGPIALRDFDPPAAGHEAALRQIAETVLSRHEETPEMGPPTCRHGESFATSSSTLVVLDGADPARSRYLFAPGPPCSTPYRAVELPPPGG